MAGIIRVTTFSAVLLLTMLSSGCTSRGITVTSNPPGAELSINRRVVGKTPMRVGFTHYGTYRFELRMKGYEVLVKEEDIKPGFYGYDPAAFVADNIIPARLNDEVYLHYNMKKIEMNGAKAADEKEKEAKDVSADDKEKGTPGDDRTALLQRANAARNGRATNPRTGTEVAIELGREVKPLPSAAPEEAMADKKEETPPPAVVVDTEPTRTISAKRPEGLRIAGEYGMTTEDDKRASFEKPDMKKTDAPKEVRVPKEEELIYDQPAMTDPNPNKVSKPAPVEKPAEKPAEQPSSAPAAKKTDPAKTDDKRKKSDSKAAK